MQAALVDRAGQGADDVLLAQELLAGSAVGSAGTAPGVASRPPRSLPLAPREPAPIVPEREVAVHPPLTA